MALCQVNSTQPLIESNIASEGYYRANADRGNSKQHAEPFPKPYLTKFRGSQKSEVQHRVHEI